ncbi:MAG: bifunctional enoyl-CoA hydratase/phosphate acetyltransferase [Stappiaceae bacterium]
MTSTDQTPSANEGTVETLALRHVHFDRLVEKAKPHDPIQTAIVAPEDTNSLGGAVLAAKATLIEPVLIGDRQKIERAAAEIGADIAGYELIDVKNHRAAAKAGVDLVNAGKAQALMKGHLHTDELLSAVVKREGGLRTGRRLTHVFVMDVPGMDRPVMVTDAAINIAPELEVMVDIVQNGIEVALSLGIAEPKVAVLSAVETVNPKIPSSMNAAILAKFADRGQIRGGIVDGPFAMDNAVDIEAARTKGLKTPVAGRADVLVAPGIDAGNILFKALTFMANAQAAGLAMGAKVPIILNSRADGEKARLASCAVAVLHQARLAGKF